MAGLLPLRAEGEVGAFIEEPGGVVQKVREVHQQGCCSDEEQVAVCGPDLAVEYGNARVEIFRGTGSKLSWALVCAGQLVSLCGAGASSETL
jgi:hypothetical protein